MKDLSTVIEDTGLEREKAKSIWVQFEGFFEAIDEAAAKVSDLEITDVSQKKEMNLARATRLELKKLRVNAGHKKKQLKEGVIKEGKFIDATYNLIADATKPIESDLLEKENFAKQKEQERIEMVRDYRIDELGKYLDNVHLMNLEKMSEESYAALLNQSKLAYEKRLEHERKMEEGRIAREKAEEEERARAQAEIERIRKEQEAREIVLARQRQEDMKRFQEEQARIERAKKEAEEMLRKAKQEKEWAELELRRQEAQEQTRKREEEIRQRRLEQSDDGERLVEYILKLKEIKALPMRTSEGARIVEKIMYRLDVSLSEAKELP